MITALIPGESIDYIPKCDRKNENPTKFILKNLSIAEDTFIREMAIKSLRGKNQEEKFIEKARIVLHIGLIGAKNFKDGKGKKAEFKRDDSADSVFKEIKPWTNETLEQIPRSIRDEIASHIISGGEMEDEERKNF